MLDGLRTVVREQLFAVHLFADYYSQDLFSQTMLSAVSVLRQRVMRTGNSRSTVNCQLAQSTVNWHCGFVEFLSCNHPTIWKFMQALKVEQAKNDVFVERSLDGQQPSLRNIRDCVTSQIISPDWSIFLISSNFIVHVFICFFLDCSGQIVDSRLSGRLIVCRTTVRANTCLCEKMSCD